MMSHYGQLHQVEAERPPECNRTRIPTITLCSVLILVKSGSTLICPSSLVIVSPGPTTSPVTIFHEHDFSKEYRDIVFHATKISAYDTGQHNYLPAHPLK